MYYPYRQRPCPPNTFPYIIRPGDTYFALARRFNTTVAALISANPGVNPNFLQIGQQICIPRQPIFPPCPEGNFYTIRPGDTLFSIARFFNVSLDDLIEANPGIDPNRLQVGQVICIPLAVPPVTCPPGSQPYTVRAGDTFFSIAQRLGVSVNDLIRLNPGVNPQALLIGQVICVPMVAPPVTCPSGSQPYIVRAGDTFFSIAQRLGVSVNDIIRLNPGVNPQALQIGQQICVPIR